MRRLGQFVFSTSLIGLHLAPVERPVIAANDQPTIEIRGDDGVVLVPAREIKSYDWTTHTITLPPGGRARLRGRVPNRQIVSGASFTVTVGDETLYSGRFTTVLSSRSFDEPTIVINGQSLDPKLGEDQIRIQLGYPTEEFFTGDDPREGDQLRVALKAAGKLIVDPCDHVAWIDRSLREMQTIKVGMTRADLRQVFVEEGGLSTRVERRYAFRECPYIKVDVRFNLADDSDQERDESPDDKIAGVSRPFLEWSISD